jgi:hypothetical protein
MTRLPRAEPTLANRRSSRPGRIVIAGLLVAGLWVAGCGSSSTSSSQSTASIPAITKAELLAKANAICNGGNVALAAAGAKLASHPSQAQVVLIVRSTYVPAIEAQITAIKALGVPAGEAATVTHMLTLAEEDLNKVKSNPALAATDVFRPFAKVAHAYGLTACAPTS